jgi:hypothetical protein
MYTVQFILNDMPPTVGMVALSIFGCPLLAIGRWLLAIGRLLGAATQAHLPNANSP